MVTVSLPLALATNLGRACRRVILAMAVRMMMMVVVVVLVGSSLVRRDRLDRALGQGVLLDTLHLAHLGEHDFTENRTADSFRKRAFLARCRRLALIAGERRGGRGGVAPVMLGSRRVGSNEGIVRHIRVFRVFFLCLERFDAVGELDKLDAPAELGFGVVGAQLGKKIAVRSGLSGEPDMGECLL